MHNIKLNDDCRICFDLNLIEPFYSWKRKLAVVNFLDIIDLNLIEPFYSWKRKLAVVAFWT